MPNENKSTTILASVQQFGLQCQSKVKSLQSPTSVCNWFVALTIADQRSDASAARVGVHVLITVQYSLIGHQLASSPLAARALRGCPPLSRRAFEPRALGTRTDTGFFTRYASRVPDEVLGGRQDAQHRRTFAVPISRYLRSVFLLGDRCSKEYSTHLMCGTLNITVQVIFYSNRRGEGERDG